MSYLIGHPKGKAAKGSGAATTGPEAGAPGGTGGGSVAPPKSKDIVEYNGRKWVNIRGKYHEYNPKNVYMVDGVKTLFIPTIEPEAVKEKTVAAADAQEEGESSVERALHNPLSVYTPEGMADMMKNLEQAKKNMAERDKLLKDLSK